MSHYFGPLPYGSTISVLQDVDPSTSAPQTPTCLEVTDTESALHVQVRPLAHSHVFQEDST